jgi:hypothetical protein
MQLTPRDKRMLQVLAVVAGLAIGYFLFTTVLGGDGGEVAAPPPQTTGATGATGTPSVSPSPTPRETLPPVVLQGARDPFSIPPGLSPSASGSVAPTGSPPGGGGGGTTTAPPPTVSPTFTTSPTTSPSPTISPTTSPSPDPDPEPQPDDSIRIGGHDVKLISIASSRKRADVRVDGKLYTVEEGASFDENFKLVNIDGDCARFLFGDQSFTLCLYAERVGATGARARGERSPVRRGRSRHGAALRLPGLV